MKWKIKEQVKDKIIMAFLWDTHQSARPLLYHIASPTLILPVCRIIPDF